MKKDLTQFLMPALALFIFTTCEKEAGNTKYPEFREKLVVYGYLSPGNKTNYISVNSNYRLYGKLYTTDKWGNLTATISDGSHEISLDSNKVGFDFNSSDFPIEEGKSYTIKIKSDFGLSAEASCTVPFRRNFDLAIDTFRAVNNSAGYYYSPFNADIYYTDFPGENNYYLMLCEQTSYDSDSYDPISTTRITGSGKEYFSDNGAEAMRARFTLGYIRDPKLVDSSFLKVYLLNIDKEYYDYKKSLDNYNDGSDPFTEPSPVFSNIVGGLGILASYTVDSLIFRLK
jgi:hypothetical protein